MNKGYWRASINSSTIHECFDESPCPGVESAEDDPNKKGYKCAIGHDGNLCTKCIEDVKSSKDSELVMYQRSGDHKCA